MNKNNIVIEKNWKSNSKEYLFELQKLIDITENIKDEELKERLRNQFLICDNVLTKFSEEMFKKYYINGLNKNKK